MLADVFAGCGGVAQRSRRVGVAAFEVDVKHGEHHDLLIRKNQQALLRGMRRGNIRALMIATPCTSFSRARRGRPPPLRDRAHPWGFRCVSEKDAERIRVGNAMARFSARLAREASARGIPWIIENPQTSMLWTLPPFERLRASRKVVEVNTHFCQFGKPWRKATKLLCGSCSPDLARALERRCHGRGLCSRTGRPHQQLSGVAPCGRFWTLIAQPYPAALCRGLVSVLLSSSSESTGHHVSSGNFQQGTG